MKYCNKCGSEIHDMETVCPNCGGAVANSNDAPSFGFALLSFLFPLVGLILYIVWRKDYPLKAKSCGKGALIGFIVSIVFSIITSVLSGILAASVAGSMANF